MTIEIRKANMHKKYIEDEINDIFIDNNIKRWTIHDTVTRKIYDVTDQGFNDGLITNVIKLRGQYIIVENGHKVWIDGIIK